MTPTVFSFSGVKIIIFPQDHDSIHIHAQYAEYETIFELYFDCGKLSNIQTRCADKEALPPQIHKKVVKFIKKHYKKIVEKWTDIIILKKPIRLTRISDI